MHLRTIAQSLRGVLIYNGGRNDGPPDLDELWRDFHRKLSGLFGGKGGGSGEGGGDGNGKFQPEMKGAGIGIGLIIAVIVLAWLGSGLFIVQEGHRAVVTTFGKYARTAEAGIGYRLPYPIQQHYTVAVTQLRSVDVGSARVDDLTGLRESAMLTQDENIVDLRFAVQYRLKDAREYLFENKDPDLAVLQAAESAVREIVGRSLVDSVLYERRDAIAAELVQSIQAQLDKLSAGVVISNVSLQNVQVPEQVQAAFDDAVKAGADRDRFKNEGQAYASDVIPKAQGTASRLREEAQGYASRIVAEADGDAKRFDSVLSEYKKAPKVTRDRLYLETMEDVYSRINKVMIDSRNNSNLLYLPLEKLLGRSAADPTTSDSSMSSSSSTSSSRSSDSTRSSTSARSRDDGRGRSREGR